MMRHLALVAACCVLLPTSVPGQAPAAVRAEVQQFVRAYIDAQNRADATAIMDMVSRKEGVSSIADGEITRGWEAMRADADEITGREGSFRLSVGSMDVVTLGPGHALILAPYTILVNTQTGLVEIRGALSMVLEKSAGTWKLVHEHYSSRSNGG